MARQDDETRSMARSISSLSNITDSVAVVRFNPEQYPPQLYWILTLIIETIQIASFSIHFDNWPISESLFGSIDEFFGYLSFWVSWSSNAFILVLFIICTVFTVVIGFLLVIGTILNKSEQNRFSFIFKIVNNISQCIFSMFFIPFLTVFSGSFICYSDGDRYEMSCGSSERLTLVIFGILMILLFLIPAVGVRVFIFEKDFKKGGFFACQHGIFTGARMVLSYIVILLYIFLGKMSYIASIIGAAIFLCLCFYCLYHQPYFHPVGNSLYSASLSFVVVVYIFGMITDLTQINVEKTPVGLLVLFWIGFFSCLIGIPILLFFITYKLGVKRFAMREGESIPYFKTKGDDLTVLSSSSSSSSSKVPASSFIPLTSSDSSSAVPTTNTTNDKQEKPLTVALMEDKKKKNKKEDKPVELLPPKPLPRYTSVTEIQQAVRFLTIKNLEKNKECLFLAEDILRYGQKEFPDSSGLFITTALYHNSFTDNSNKMGEALRSAKQCIPTVIERFLIFALLRDISRRHAKSGSSNNDATNVAFRLNFEKGTRAHETSKAYLKQAYIYLSKDNKDLQKIQLFLDKAIRYEAEARETFEDLLKRHPNSVQLLRAFGALLRDIYRDDETATAMFTEANLLEEDEAQNTMGGDDYEERNSRISGRSKISSFASPSVAGGLGGAGQGMYGTVDVDDIGNTDKKKKKRRRRSSSSNAALKITSNEENLLPFVMPTIFLCVIIIIVCLIVTYVLVIDNFTETSSSITNIDDIASVEVCALSAAVFSYFFQLRMFQDNGEPIVPEGCTFLPDWEFINYTNDHNGDKIGKRLAQIYEATINTDELSAMEEEYLELLWTEYYKEGIVGMFRDKLIVMRTSALDLASEIAYINLDMAHFWDFQDSGKTSYLYFVRNNIPVNLMEGLKRLSSRYSINAEKHTTIIIILCVLMLIFSMLAPVVIIVGQLLYTIVKLKKERRNVMLEMCCQPKEAILQLKKRLDEVDKDDLDENNTKDSIEGTFTNNEDVSEASENENDKDENGLLKGNKNSNNLNNQKHSSQLYKSEVAGSIDNNLARINTSSSSRLIGPDGMNKPGTAFSSIYLSSSASLQGTSPLTQGLDGNMIGTSPWAADGQLGGGLESMSVSQLPPMAGVGLGNNPNGVTLSRSNSVNSQTPLLNTNGAGVGTAPLPPLTRPETALSLDPLAMTTPGMNTPQRVMTPVVNLNGSVVVSNDMLGLSRSPMSRVGSTASLLGLQSGGGMVGGLNSSVTGFNGNIMGGTQSASSPLANKQFVEEDLIKEEKRKKNDEDNEEDKDSNVDYEKLDEEHEKEREKELEDESREEMKEKISKIKGIIPTSFYVRLFAGLFIIDVSVIMFYVVCIYVSKHVVELNNAILLAGYRTTMGIELSFLVFSLGVPDLPTFNYCNRTVDYSTMPHWIGYEHLGSKKDRLGLLEKHVQYFSAINYRLHYGSDKGEEAITGDSLLDSLDLDATLVEGAGTINLMYDQADCMMDEEECFEGRLYGMSDTYSGLSALMDRLFTSLNALIELEEEYFSSEDSSSSQITPPTGPPPEGGGGDGGAGGGMGGGDGGAGGGMGGGGDVGSQLQLDNDDLQIIMSLEIYDGYEGMKKYKNILETEQGERVESEKSLLVAIFIIAAILSFLGALFGFLPAPSILRSVARTTSKIHMLNPESDAEERTGMRQAAWREEYSCDCNRTDIQHKRILIRLALVCGAIDPDINISTQLEELKQEMQERENRSLKKTVLEAENLCFGSASVGRNVNMDSAKGITNEEEKKKMQKKKSEVVIKLLKELVIVTLSSLDDEEHLMNKYRIPHSHTKQHFLSHASLIRSIQKESLNIAKQCHSAKHNFSAAPTDAQELSQTYVGWLTDHVNKLDREFIAVLQGKAPPSELEKDVCKNEFVVPKSYAQFLQSDNASLQEKSLFDKLKAVLKLE